MKIYILVFSFLLTSFSHKSFSQESQQNFLERPYLELKKFTLKEKTEPMKIPALPSSGAAVGYNLGLAFIQSQVGFAVGVFAELKTGGFSFIPQANYWTASGQNNFELAGLARFYLSPEALMPYLDGGLGVNFYNAENTSFTKLSILIGGGIVLAVPKTSFDLIFDGKYKLIINDQNNISCFIFTAGMKFPFN